MLEAETRGWLEAPVITAGVRLALSRAARGAPCCQWAELIGMVRVAGGVRITPSGEVRVVATLPTMQAAERLLTTLRAHSTAQPTLIVPDPAADHRQWAVVVAPGRELAQRSGLLDRRGRLVVGVPPRVLRGACDAAAVWRGALLAAAPVAGRGPRRGLAVACPNIVVAVALVGLARRLGARARVTTRNGVEHAHLTDPTDIMTLLTQAGGIAAATAWQHDHDPLLTAARRPAVLRAANTTRSRVASSATAIAQIARAFAVLDPSAVSPLLRSAGQLRLDHPDLSITALAALADPPVTKSALAGRLRRLVALSNARNSPGPPGL